MKMNNTISRFLTMLLFLQDYIVSSMGNTIQTTYVVTKNKRASTIPDKVVYTVSTIACAGACRLSEGCKTANFLTTDGKCYLFNRLCVFTIDATEWSILTLKPPEKEYLYIPEKKIWNEAKEYCESINGQLAKILTSADNNEVIHTVTPIPDPASVWIGGSDIGSEGNWYWTDWCFFNDQDFHFWGPDQPNNYNNNQNCLAIYKWPEGFAWDDDDCDLYQHTFICERFIS